MWVRVSKVRRDGKVYRYAQLVQSYRNDEGKPRTRIIRSLGPVTEEQGKTLKAAVKAAKAAGADIAEITSAPAQQHVALGTRRYLDLAVLLEVLRDEGLHDFLSRLFAERADTSVPIADVLCVLILQRCTAPASKLAAQRWFPRTALPELLAIEPAAFNNSRIHRALSALDSCDAELQRQLPDHLAVRHDRPVALLLDATDTWFEGRGPDIAARGRDKHGIYRRRIGLVILCDPTGLPLRWHVIDGRFHDATALMEMANEAAAIPWAKGLPLIVDRALGQAGFLDRIEKLGYRFLTCIPACELDSCGAPIPWSDLEKLSTHDGVEEVEQALVAAGFSKINSRRYIKDLKTFDKNRAKNAPRASVAVFAMDVLEVLESSEASRKELSSQLNMSSSTLQRLASLRTLLPAIRKRLRAGDGDRLTRERLYELAKVVPEDQDAALDRLVSLAPATPRRVQRKHAEDQMVFRARGVLVVNPERLVQERKSAEEALSNVKVLLQDVNRRLASPRSTRKDANALGEVQKRIDRARLGAVCTLELKKRKGTRSIEMSIDESAWNRRRSTDGLALVVAHHAHEAEASELVAQYFAKDVIEKDFQLIKSVLDLRPIRHQSDHKVRAHVTLCVLALLLERLLERRLAVAGQRQTAAAALEKLEMAHLNLLQSGNTRYHTVTRLDRDASSVLKALGMQRLADDDAVTKAITPRAIS